MQRNSDIHPVSGFCSSDIHGLRLPKIHFSEIQRVVRLRSYFTVITLLSKSTISFFRPTFFRNSHASLAGQPLARLENRQITQTFHYSILIQLIAYAEHNANSGFSVDVTSMSASTECCCSKRGRIFVVSQKSVTMTPGRHSGCSSSLCIAAKYSQMSTDLTRLYTATTLGRVSTRKR